MNNNEFANYNPNRNNVQMTYNEAQAALAAEPKVYEVRIDGKRVSLLTLYKVLGNLPSSVRNILVYHPDHWQVLFGITNQNNGDWYIYRSDPISKYGMITRTIGTLFTNKENIWDWIVTFFPGIEDQLQIQQMASKKLANLRTKALLETSRREGFPENLETYLLPSYFEENPRPLGYGEVLQNFKRINTTLFQNGGKRRSKKSKTKKSKRSSK
jgi:hypothetical protein